VITKIMKYDHNCVRFGAAGVRAWDGMCESDSEFLKLYSSASKHAQWWMPARMASSRLSKLLQWRST